MGKLKITLEDLFNIPSAVIYNPDGYSSLSSVQIDSRKVRKGTLFIAIKGEKLDGHDFISDAIKNGARAIVINKNKLKRFSKIDLPIIAVDDTIKAYGFLANVWRHKLNAKVIGITGSNGKTSTKEILATLLSERFNVVKTEANNNNHIGVPLTIFNADEKTEMLVLEHGTNHFGEIEYTAKISQPDFALITNIGDSHIEFFKTREGIYKEKSQLFVHTVLNNGTVFINIDDPIISENKNSFRKKITYGFTNHADYKGVALGITDEGKTKIKINYSEGKFETTLPIYGDANAKNYLASFAIAKTIGMTNREILSATKKLTPAKGRLEVTKYKNAVLIDDTYNASPMSIEAAIKTLNSIKTFEKKYVVLGDIFELGNQAKKIHKKLAEIFQPAENLFVLTVGDMMKYLTTELRKKKIKSIHFNEREALSLYLQYEEIENSVILVKGSRGMKMEEFLNILKQRFE